MNLEKYRKYILNDLGKIILTSVLTTIGTFTVMWKQLSQEQTYWLDRTNRERMQVIMDRKISLLEEINTEILVIEVLAKDIKFETALTKEYLKHSIIPDKEDVHRLYNKEFEYHKNINELAGKLQVLSLYFGNLDSILVPLAKSLEENYLNNNSFREPINPQTDYFNKDFRTIEKLSNDRIRLLRAMIEDIAILSQKLYAEDK